MHGEDDRCGTVEAHPAKGMVETVGAFGLAWMVRHRERRAPTVKGSHEQSLELRFVEGTRVDIGLLRGEPCRLENVRERETQVRQRDPHADIARDVR